MARHSRQAKLDGMAAQVDSVGECMAAALAASCGIAHPLRMKSAHASHIRLSFMMSFGAYLTPI